MSPKQLRMITSFHKDMHGTVQYDGSSSQAFPIRNSVKHGCVLAPTSFGIFFSVLFSVHLQKVFAYIRGLMANCSFCPVRVRKQKYDKSWLDCSLIGFVADMTRINVANSITSDNSCCWCKDSNRKYANTLESVTFPHALYYG